MALSPKALVPGEMNGTKLKNGFFYLTHLSCPLGHQYDGGRL